MHSPFRTRGIVPTVALAFALAVALPALAAAKPEPGTKPRGFRLLSGAIGAMQVNRVFCGLATNGTICVNAAGSSTVGGANWPRGTANQYIFNTGLQLAGIIGPDGGPWAGDTTGAFFFNPRGGGNGTQVRELFDASDASDLANWPTAAYVPTTASGDEGAALYSDLLQGTKQASQGDVWWVSWEGDAAQTSGGRPHPLGMVVETRGMGWNFPSGNEDIIYFIYTFYNVTSTNRADYVGIREPMVDILMEQAQTFQAQNNAKFGITLPAGGYTITQAYAAFGTDMDVADASVNYASVNLPFALGYTYVGVFEGADNWTFDPGIFGTPFFEGAGFAGVKYLKAPDGPGAIQLYSNTVNGTPFPGAFNDANNTTQLWRYLSGKISTAAGDQNCNTGNQQLTHICWIDNTQPTDIRFYQSSTELTLPPGGQGSIVVAYVFAAPVAVPGCASAGCLKPNGVKPEDPTLLGSAARMASGVNLVDSITGYAGFNNANADTLIEQTEFLVVNGSLLGKSLTAQAVFDSKFLLPFAPAAPRFFTIPGDGQVTVLWQPSPSETTGDPYADLANDVGSALYNPNYRKYDIEGYRIYRGRVNNPSELFLVAQFDYDGTVFNDYDALVNPVATCAPELDIFDDCPVTFDPVIPGQPRTVPNVINIVSPLVQTKYGDRLELASGLALTTKADTAVTGLASGQFRELTNTGVPFVWVDTDVRNNFNYYYVVTAFDVNSYTSGPSSLESPKANPVGTTPQKPASNAVQTATLTPGMFGGWRQPGDVNTTDQSALFPNTPGITSNGTFTGPFPPATIQLGFVGFASQVINSGSLSATLDSLHLGDVDLTGCCGGGQPGVPAVYYFTLSNGVDPAVQVSVPLQQDLANDVSTNVYFAGPPIEVSLSSLYGGTGSYGNLNALFKPTLTTGPKSGDWGLGAALGEPGFGNFTPGATGANYNGFRWFDGPSPANNETKADPIAGSCGVGTGACASNGTTGGFNNAGQLTGVTTVYQPLSYNMYNREWRNVGETISSATRAADFNVYWGGAGVIDSVIDITHNVPVDYDGQTVRGGWAILNNSGQGAGGFDNRPTVLTPTDWTCVAPLRTQAPGSGTNTFFPCASSAPFTLSNVAELGTIAFGSGNAQSATATLSDRNPANVQAQGGFFLYLAGTITGFEMPSLPAAGTVWSLRSYTGIIFGGNGLGQSGNIGPYGFRAATRPFTAIHATMGVQYDVVNDFTAAASNLDLSKVHTVPDPYYVTSEYEVDWTSKIIKFVNLPTQATIRIYSASGVLVRVLNFNSADAGNDPSGGVLDWNVRNRSNQIVASGVYFYHVESGDARYIGRMTIVNFAQ